MKLFSLVIIFISINISIHNILGAYAIEYIHRNLKTNAIDFIVDFNTSLQVSNYIHYIIEHDTRRCNGCEANCPKCSEANSYCNYYNSTNNCGICADNSRRELTYSSMSERSYGNITLYDIVPHIEYGCNAAIISNAIPIDIYDTINVDTRTYYRGYAIIRGCDYINSTYIIGCYNIIMNTSSLLVKNGAIINNTYCDIFGCTSDNFDLPWWYYNNFTNPSSPIPTTVVPPIPTTVVPTTLTPTTLTPTTLVPTTSIPTTPPTAISPPQEIVVPEPASNTVLIACLTGAGFILLIAIGIIIHYYRKSKKYKNLSTSVDEKYIGMLNGDTFEE